MTAAVVHTSGGTHFPALNAYRAVGMLMVLANHAAFATGFVLRHDLGRVIARFDIAVPMFFVMSGFLLYRPYAVAAFERTAVPDLRQFYRGRLLRIVPGYWLALIGVAALFGTSAPDVRGWIANLLVLPAFGVDAAYAITPAWSIGVEVCFYALLPLYGVLLARRAARSAGVARCLLLGAAALFVAGQLFRFGVVLGLEGNPSIQARSLLVLPMYLDLFATGIALAVLSVNPTTQLERITQWSGRHPALCWLLAGGLLLAVSTMRAPTAPFGLNGVEYLPRQFAYSVISAIWLAPAIFGDQRSGRLRALLSSRPLHFAGAISLSFYLWHLSFVEEAKRWTISGYDRLVETASRAAVEDPDSLQTLVTFTGSFPRVALVATAATAVVATLVYKLVEEPFLKHKGAQR